jgi:hypothetical protein
MPKKNSFKKEQKPQKAGKNKQITPAFRGKIKNGT